MGLFQRIKQGATDKALAKLLGGAEPPSFPQMTVRILERVRDQDADIHDITESLQWDPGLVLRVLRTVNTAAYGPSSPIHDVKHAISYMGRAQLEQIVLAIAVRQTLPNEPAASFEPRRFWLAASRRAALARSIADKLHPSTSAECFTAGLLQDMAVPILAHARPKDYGPILAEWHADGPALEELERDRLGWTHADVGGLLSRTWELPAVLAEAIFHHHRAGRTDAQLQPALRLVATLRETKSELGDEAFVEVGRAEYGLESDWLCDALRCADEQAQELASLMA